MRWYQVSHLISCSREAHNFLARDMYYLRWSKLVSMFDICSINHQSSVSVSTHSRQPELCCWYVRWPLHERNWRPDKEQLNQILFKLNKSNGFLMLSGFPFLFHFCTLYMAPWLEQGLFHHPGHPSWELPPAWTCRCQHFQWPGSTVGFPSPLVPCISKDWLERFIVQLRSCHCDILHVFFHPVVCHVLNPRRKAQFMDHGSDPLRSNQSGALMAPGPINGMHDHNNVWPTWMVHRVLLHLTCFRLAINAIKNTNPSKGSAKNLLIISGNVFVIRSGTIHVLVQQFLIDLLLLLQKVLNSSVTSYHMILRPSHLLALWSPSHWQSPPPGPPGSWC